MDFAAKVFGQNVFTIFQDNGPSVDTRGVRFRLILVLGMDYAANAFQPTRGALQNG
jgi:hypothetical protein